MENKNILVMSDCLIYLKNLYKDGISEFIDLIYIDPPFNSQRNFNILFDSKSVRSERAFDDTWSNVSYIEELEEIAEINLQLYEFIKNLEICGESLSCISYLTMIGLRCLYMYKMLKPTGTFYFHCDDMMSAHVRLMLNIIFGRKNFRSKICWKRNFSPGSGRKCQAKKYSRNLDYIFQYTKSDDYYFDCPKIPMDEEKIRKGYKFNDDDGCGDYFWAPFNYIPKEEVIKSGIANNTIRWKETTKYPEYKKFKDKSDLSIKIGNLWEDIKPVINNKENLGYPTQKPEKLMRRIIESSSREGELVADFFGGGGTTEVVAEKLKRRWLCTDLNFRAIQITKERLENLNRKIGRDFVIEGIPMTIQDLKKTLVKSEDNGIYISGQKLEDVVFKYYIKNIRVIGNKCKTKDNSIDGRYTFKYKGKLIKGIVQVTSSETSSMNHLKAFCSELAKGSGEYAVYISFDESFTKGIRKEADGYGKKHGVRIVQLISFEDLLERGKEIQIPSDFLTI